MNFSEFEKFFEKKRNISLFFLFLIFFQIFYSFLFPAYNDNFYWKTVKDLNFYQGYSFDNFDGSILQKTLPLIEKYRMNLDGGGYLLLAHDFPSHYFKGNYTFLTRPLYPILVNLVSRPLHIISDSYSMTFAAGLLVNFILFFFTVYLFYALVKKIISFRVAFLSSVLLIFSPLAHIWLIQPETNIFGIFLVIFGLWMLHNYWARPSFKKLIIFSLIFGILLLGKKIFALSVFILLLSFLFKRKREGLLFFFVHLIPSGLWTLWTSKVWGMPFYVDEVSHFGFGVWILNIFSWPWYKTIQVFLNSFPQFIYALTFGFLGLSLIFAVLGYKEFSLPKKSVLVFTFVFSFFLLFLGTNVYYPRFGFWLYPLVYPLTVLGIDRTAKFFNVWGKWYPAAFSILIYFLIILISSLNIYKIVDYG